MGHLYHGYVKQPEPILPEIDGAQAPSAVDCLEVSEGPGVQLVQLSVAGGPKRPECGELWRFFGEIIKNGSWTLPIHLFFLNKLE